MIHKSEITLSSSMLYCSYFAGMLWAIVSQYKRVDSDSRRNVFVKISAWYVH